MQFIGLVKDIFEIKGKGLILCLEYSLKKYFLSIGDNIKLVKPNEEIVISKIHGIVFQSLDILIEDEDLGENISVGTEVWLMK